MDGLHAYSRMWGINEFEANGHLPEDKKLKVKIISHSP